MKKYVLPSLLILAIGAGIAIAQNITKAIQLSQDATGAFGVDTNNGVFFPGHWLVKPAVVPTVSSGATTPSIVGSDASGLITVAAAATTVTLTFATAYVTAPWCLVSPNATSTTTTVSWTTATTNIAITESGAAGTMNKLNYFCSSTG